MHNSVLKLKTSFSGYCAEMTRKYITCMDNAAHFMCPNTLKNVFCMVSQYENTLQGTHRPSMWP